MGKYHLVQVCPALLCIILPQSAYIYVFPHVHRDMYRAADTDCMHQRKIDSSIISALFQHINYHQYLFRLCYQQKGTLVCFIQMQISLAKSPRSNFSFNFSIFLISLPLFFHFRDREGRCLQIHPSPSCVWFLPIKNVNGLAIV